MPAPCTYSRTYPKVTLESGRVGWELPACTEAEAASISTRMIAHVRVHTLSA